MDDDNIKYGIEIILKPAKDCVSSMEKLENLINDCNDYVDKKIRPPQYIMDFAKEVYELFISENKHIPPKYITYATDLYIKTMVLVSRLSDEKYITKDERKKFQGYREKIAEIFKETADIINKNLEKIN
ncbi:Uncharacterised protein [Candidatus Tiddalikarchaeum anstoanum]|nr:Uncharacterised protein [Candidatus Tiddalikarchaeum anstoanum]